MKRLLVFQKKVSPLFLIIALLTTQLLLSSCAKNDPKNPVKGVELATSTENGDIFIELAGLFDLGRSFFSAAKLAIKDPFDPNSNPFGIINFRPNWQATLNEISVKLNLSKAAQIPGTFPTLPNGDEIPFTGIPYGSITEFEIEKIHSKFYVALDRDITMLGFAVGIKEFDAVSEHLGGSNIFLAFEFRGVRGMAGLFSGNTSYEKGLAFFIDLSSVISGSILSDILNGSYFTQDSIEEIYEEQSVNPPWKYNPEKLYKNFYPSKWTLWKAGRFMNRHFYSNRRGKKIRILNFVPEKK